MELRLNKLWLGLVAAGAVSIRARGRSELRLFVSVGRRRGRDASQCEVSAEQALDFAPAAGVARDRSFRCCAQRRRSPAPESATATIAKSTYSCAGYQLAPGSHLLSPVCARSRIGGVRFRALHAGREFDAREPFRVLAADRCLGTGRLFYQGHGAIGPPG